MRSIYKEKSSGNLLEFDVQHNDTALVVFQREGGGREMMERKKFDELYELVSAEAPSLPEAGAPEPARVARTKYREKKTGTITALDIREMDMNHVVFAAAGRAPQHVSRSDFDDTYEVILPAVQPKLIPTVAVVPSSGRPDPTGAPVVSQQVPPPDVPEVIKAIRALGDRFHRVEDAMEETLAKVTTLYRKVTEPAPELPPAPAAPKKDPTA